MRRIRKYIACALSAAMVMSSAFVQGAVVSHAEEQDVGIVATAGDAEEADGVQTEDAEAEVEEENGETEELDAQRETSSTSEGLEYEATDDGITITGYTGEATEVVIPSEIDGKSVTSIGASAFSECESLTAVTLPEGLLSIESGAFKDCTGLTSINIPKSVTSISQTRTGYEPYIPSTGNAFAGCSNLTNITVDEGNEVYESRNCNAIIIKKSDVLIVGGNKTVVPDGVAIDEQAFSDRTGLTSVSISGSVGASAFKNCSGLKSVTVSGEGTNILEGAFANCTGLTSLDIQEGVKCLALSAFLGCSSLSSVDIPASVTEIESWAFDECGSLTSITVDEDNTVYDSRNGCNAIIETATNTLIRGCKNTVIPNTVTIIGSHAFCGCSDLTSIIIPANVTDIKAGAFNKCSSDLTIFGDEGSTAQEYANSNSIKFEKIKYVTEITLDPASKTLAKGKSVTLKATVKPSDATTKDVTWESSKESVATVSSSGKVTAKKAGTATITCYATDGSGKKATCKITVTAPVTKVKLDATSKTIAKGKSVTLKATVSPSDATNKAVTWKSSNKSVATVSSNGKVTAKKVGTATITCTTKDGKKTATCKITVKTPVTKVKLNKTGATIKTGKTLTLKATVTPGKAYQKVTWKSSNTKVATVSSSGKVTAKKKGTATITCTAADGSGKKVTCKITVK
jgi:uncharacterized protein YjdB